MFMNIFISSTKEDLEEERNELFKWINKDNHVLGMENFGGYNVNSEKFIKRDIKKADLIILIIGFKYGSIREEDSISWTEFEYKFSKEELNKPIFAYVKSKEDGWINCEKGDFAVKLENFKNKVCEKQVSFFKNKDELCKNVIRDICNYEKTIEHVFKSTNDVYSLEDFIKKSENQLQPSLSNKFLGRDEEFDFILNKLNENNFFILTGEIGVGKSKLAISVAEYYEEKYNYKSIVITNLNQDIEKCFSKSFDEDIFIIFDDLNGNFTGLKNIISTIYNLKVNYKVIFTVRNYFKEDLHEELVLFNFCNENHFLDITEFKRDDLKLLINDYCNDKGYVYSDDFASHIIKIGKNKPRLILMVLECYNPNVNDLTIFKCYKIYFNEIKKDKLIKGSNTFKSIAILSLFEKIDLNNDFFTNLFNNFNIDYDELIRIFIKLSEDGLINYSYKYNYVRIDDKSLMIYMFYTVFINNESSILNFLELVNLTIDTFPVKLNNILNDILNTFSDGRNIREEIYYLIKPLIHNFNDFSQKSWNFYDIFWYFCPFESFEFIKKYISTLVPKDNIEINLSFERKNNYYSYHKPLNLLSYFISNNLYLKESLELSFKYLEYDSSDFNFLSSKIINSFNITRRDLNNNFERQLELLNILDAFNEEDNKVIADKLFLDFAYHFLDFRFSCDEQISDLEVEIKSIDLSNHTNILKEFRETIINKLLKLYNIYPNDVRIIINRYMDVIPNTMDDLLLSTEKELCTDFFVNNLDLNSFEDCLLVSKYCDFLKSNNQDFSELTKFLDNDLIKIYKLYFDVDFDSDINKLSLIEEEIHGKDFSFIKNTLNNINQVSKVITPIQGQFFIIELFDSIYKEDNMLFLESFLYYLESDFNFSFIQGTYKTTNLINNFKELISQNKISCIQLIDEVCNSSYENKKFFLELIFADIISKNEVNGDILIKFINCLRCDKNIVVNFNKLNRYYDNFNEIFVSMNISKNHKNIITYIVDTLLKYNIQDVYLLSDFFKKYNYYFKDYVSLFKELFFRWENNVPYVISDEFEGVFDLDPNFLKEYFEHLFNENDYISRIDVDLSFIWKKEENYKYIEDVFLLLSDYKYKFSSVYHPANILFEDCKKNKYETKRFILNLIEKYHSTNYISGVMDVALNYFTDEFIEEFLDKFLELNDDFNYFEKIPLVKKYRMIGDLIKELNNEITFLKSIKKHIENKHSLRFTNHITYIDNLILSKKERIDKEKKHQFLE